MPLLTQLLGGAKSSNMTQWKDGNTITAFLTYLSLYLLRNGKERKKIEIDKYTHMYIVTCTSCRHQNVNRINGKSVRLHCHIWRCVCVCVCVHVCECGVCVLSFQQSRQNIQLKKYHEIPRIFRCLFPVFLK